MRNQPYIDDLEKIVPSRYTMVVGVAKRARQIMEEKIYEESPYDNVVKPVSIAMYELLEKKIQLVELPAEKKEKTIVIRQEFDDLD